MDQYTDGTKVTKIHPETTSNYYFSTEITKNLNDSLKEHTILQHSIL